MKTKPQLRALVRDGLDDIISGVNAALRGDNNLKAIRPILERNGRGGVIPHWFDVLSSKGTLPNLDGKTIGSVIEMLLIAILERHTFKSIDIPPLRVNPARGVDLPDLDLGASQKARLNRPPLSRHHHCTSYFSLLYNHPNLERSSL